MILSLISADIGSAGLGGPQLAERTEKRMVAREEGADIITTGTAVTQDWDAAWDSDGEPDEESSNGRNRRSLDEQRRATEVFSKSNSFRIVDYSGQCSPSFGTFHGSNDFVFT